MVYRNRCGSVDEYLTFDPMYYDMINIGVICSHGAIFSMLPSNLKRDDQFFINWLSGKFDGDFDGHLK